MDISASSCDGVVLIAAIFRNQCDERGNISCCASHFCFNGCLHSLWLAPCESSRLILMWRSLVIASLLWDI